MPTLTAQRERIRPRRSLFLHPTTSETDSVFFNASDMIQYPDVEAVRQVRAEAMNRVPEKRREKTKREMASHAPRRTYSDATSYKIRRSNSTMHEEMRRSESRRRHRTHMPQWVASGDHDKGANVLASRSRNHRKDAEKKHAKELARSKSMGGRSRPKYDPLQEEGAHKRRHSGRPVSHDEARSLYTPLRRGGKRSVATHASRPRKDEPAFRSASVLRTQSPRGLFSFLHRGQNSAGERPASKTSPRDIHTPLVPMRSVSECNVPKSRRPSNVSKSPIPMSKVPAPYRHERPSTASQGTNARKSSGILPAFLASPKPSSRAEPQKLVTCNTCLSETEPISKCPKLSCSHRMCHDCLKRLFTLSVTDAEHMPPKCCNAEINQEHVEKLFDVKFKLKWNRRYYQWKMKGRIPCPAKGCREWLKPSHMNIDTSGGATHGRKYGICRKCKTKVCALCSHKWHNSSECPNDTSSQEFIKLAKEKGWQTCYNCRAIVELKEGCNHMTCSCKAEFCMCCGLKWKTCECQMFSDEAIAADRLAQFGNMPLPNPAAAERAYRQRRREQEMRDEALARRMMQELDIDDGFNTFGNAHPHFMNDDMRHTADALFATLNHTEEARQQRRRPPEPIVIPFPPGDPIYQQGPAMHQWNNNRPPGRQNERLVPRRARTDYATEANLHRPFVIQREGLLAGMASGQAGEARVDEWRRHVDPLA